MAALTLAGGIIFFLVAFRQLLQEYERRRDRSAADRLADGHGLEVDLPGSRDPLRSRSRDRPVRGKSSRARIEVIVALLLVVMVLNLLAMLYAHRILNGPTVLVLQVVGALLGVLQVAFSCRS